MTFGLACDRDGYDLRQPKCSQCGSRGCPKMHDCLLNPCRCGGKASLERSISRTMWAVECRSCGATTKSIYLKAETIKRWNGGDVLSLASHVSNTQGISHD
jgi:hypothetical protein